MPFEYFNRIGGGRKGGLDINWSNRSTPKLIFLGRWAPFSCCKDYKKSCVWAGSYIGNAMRNSYRFNRFYHSIHTVSNSENTRVALRIYVCMTYNYETLLIIQSELPPALFKGRYLSVRFIFADCGTNTPLIACLRCGYYSKKRQGVSYLVSIPCTLCITCVLIIPEQQRMKFWSTFYSRQKHGFFQCRMRDIRILV